MNGSDLVAAACGSRRSRDNVSDADRWLLFPPAASFLSDTPPWPWRGATWGSRWSRGKRSVRGSRLRQRCGWATRSSRLASSSSCCCRPCSPRCSSSSAAPQSGHTTLSLSCRSAPSPPRRAACSTACRCSRASRRAPALSAPHTRPSTHPPFPTHPTPHLLPTGAHPWLALPSRARGREGRAAHAAPQPPLAAQVYGHLPLLHRPRHHHLPARPPRRPPFDGQDGIRALPALPARDHMRHLLCVPPPPALLPPQPHAHPSTPTRPPLPVRQATNEAWLPLASASSPSSRARASARSGGRRGRSAEIRDSISIPPRFSRDSSRDSAEIPAEILLLLSSPRGHPSSPHSLPAGAAQRVRARGLLAARAARHPRPGLGRRARGRAVPHVHLLPEHLGSHRVHLRDRQQRRDAHPPRPLHQDRPRRRPSLPARGLCVRVRRQPPHRLRTSPRHRDRPVR